MAPALIVGVGMSPFRKPSEDNAYEDMALEATCKALVDANLNYDSVEAAYCGYVYGDSTCGQRALYPLGMTQIPIINTNNNCSTGSTALFLARAAVESGQYECVLALGFEKMERGSLGSKFMDRTNPLDLTMSMLTEVADFDFSTPGAPSIFGAAGDDFSKKYGTTAEHQAKIGYKNHKHSALNPYAQFRQQYSLEQIKNAPRVYGPLTKLQCSPTSDGAAAAIICSPAFAKKNKLAGIELAAQTMATDSPRLLSERNALELAGCDMTRKAARKAYEQAGVTPGDVQVVELHDCFSSNEMITYSAIGLCKPEDTAKYIDEEQQTFGGRCVVNPSGGLISKGHPLGATGLAQCAELNWQLRGWCEERQVPNVKHALQHNIGLGGACVVAIYRHPRDGSDASFDGQKRLGYNPAVEARPLSQKEFDFAKSQQAPFPGEGPRL